MTNLDALLKPLGKFLNVLIEKVWNLAETVLVCQDQDWTPCHNSLSESDEQFCMTARTFSTNLDALLKPHLQFLNCSLNKSETQPRLSWYVKTKIWTPCQDPLSASDGIFCTTAMTFSTNIDAILKPHLTFLYMLIEQVWNPAKTVFVYQYQDLNPLSRLSQCVRWTILYDC
jgi:hypothetical protein